VRAVLKDFLGKIFRVPHIRICEYTGKFSGKIFSSSAGVCMCAPARGTEGNFLGKFSNSAPAPARGTEGNFHTCTYIHVHTRALCMCFSTHILKKFFELSPRTYIHILAHIHTHTRLLGLCVRNVQIEKIFPYALTPHRCKRLQMQMCRYTPYVCAILREIYVRFSKPCSHTYVQTFARICMPVCVCHIPTQTRAVMFVR